MKLTKEEAAILLYETSCGEKLPDNIALFIERVRPSRYREFALSARKKLKALIDEQTDISDAEEETLP